MARKVIFDKKNIVVIGGAGFIGSHLCDELVKHAKVICVDNYASSDVNNITHLLQNPDFIFSATRYYRASGFGGLSRVGYFSGEISRCSRNILSCITDSSVRI
jgi:UDP-glucose 4-epimerase